MDNLTDSLQSMTNDADRQADYQAEAALIALAEPVTWQFLPDARGSQHWIGKYGDTTYHLDPPLGIHSVDAEESLHTWRITLFPPHTPNHGRHVCNARTEEEGKTLCLRHALSGDLNEMQALHESQQAQDVWFWDLYKSAMAYLRVYFSRGHGIEMLPCTPAPSIPESLQFTLRGRLGRYEARWEPGRRWLVRFYADDGTHGHEKRFLTRRHLVMACALHNQTLYWVGTLDKSSQI